MRTIKDEFDYRPSALTRAIDALQSGRRISLTLAASLLEEGYDVQAIERRFSKQP